MSCAASAGRAQRCPRYRSAAKHRDAQGAIRTRRAPTRPPRRPGPAGPPSGEWVRVRRRTCGRDLHPEAVRRARPDRDRSASLVRQACRREGLPGGSSPDGGEEPPSRGASCCTIGLPRQPRRRYVATGVKASGRALGRGDVWGGAVEGASGSVAVSASGWLRESRPGPDRTWVARGVSVCVGAGTRRVTTPARRLVVEEPAGHRRATVAGRACGRGALSGCRRRRAPLHGRGWPAAAARARVLALGRAVRQGTSVEAPPAACPGTGLRRRSPAQAERSGSKARGGTWPRAARGRGVGARAARGGSSRKAKALTSASARRSGAGNAENTEANICSTVGRCADGTGVRMVKPILCRQNVEMRVQGILHGRHAEPV